MSKTEGREKKNKFFSWKKRSFFCSFFSFLFCLKTQGEEKKKGIEEKGERWGKAERKGREKVMMAF